MLVTSHYKKKTKWNLVQPNPTQMPQRIAHSPKKHLSHAPIWTLTPTDRMSTPNIAIAHTRRSHVLHHDTHNMSTPQTATCHFELLYLLLLRRTKVIVRWMRCAICYVHHLYANMSGGDEYSMYPQCFELYNTNVRLVCVDVLTLCDYDVSTTSPRSLD